MTATDFTQPDFTGSAFTRFSRGWRVPANGTDDLRERVGDDSTAMFEDDPEFVDSNPGGPDSSDNVCEQAEALRADGLPGHEDEAEDAEKKRDRTAGDAARAQ